MKHSQRRVLFLRIELQKSVLKTVMFVAVGYYSIATKCVSSSVQSKYIFSIGAGK